MKENGTFRSADDLQPQPCHISFASQQVVIYLRNPENLLVWSLGRIKQAQYDGTVLHAVSDAEPAEEINCTGPVATDIYTAWLERDVPRKQKSSFSVKHLALIAVAGVLITGAFYYLFYAAMPFLAGKAASLVPVDWEVALGDQLSNSILQQPDSVVQNDSVNFYLAEFTSKLNLKTDYPIRVRVIQSDEINAFALPGGNIFIYFGLLQKMQTPEELVALLSHEITHVTHRHSLKSILSSAAAGILFSAFFGDMGGVSSFVISKAEEFKQLEYSRELETEADLAGLELMKSNNVDPKGMLRLLKLLQDESGKTPALMKYLSTHPETEERIRTVNGKISAVQFTTDTELRNIFEQIRLQLSSLPQTSEW
jgi:beta-barrel assembly-enhancing protease